MELGTNINQLFLGCVVRASSLILLVAFFSCEEFGGCAKVAADHLDVVPSHVRGRVLERVLARVDADPRDLPRSASSTKEIWSAQL